jgi:hypothetical protein
MSRPAYDFDPESNTGFLTKYQVHILLKKNQVGLLTFIAFELIIDALWALANIVPGFALFDGQAGQISAYTHSGWWLSIEMIVLAMGIASTYFALHYATDEGKLELSVSRTDIWLTAYQIVLFLGFCSLLVQTVLTFFELNPCTSTLCTQYYWCLIVVIVFLIVLAMMEIWMILRARVFQLNMRHALTRGNVETLVAKDTPTTRVPSANPKASAPPAEPPSYNEVYPEASAPPKEMLHRLRIQRQLQNNRFGGKK